MFDQPRSVPRIVLDREQYEALIRFVPCYHACVHGPETLAGRTLMQIDGILASSFERAEKVVWGWVREVCCCSNYSFDEDEWQIEHLVTQNCC